MARKLQDTVQLKLRFSEALRRRLEREAKRQEQSLNAEIISRLEQSFRKAEDDDLIASTFRAAFGATGDLLRAIVTVIWLIERRTGEKWNEDRDTAFQIEIAMEAVLRAFVSPLNAVRAFLELKLEEMVVGGERVKRERIHEPGMVAALEALQKMGMAPSDAEIAEAAKRVEAQEAAKRAQAQEAGK